MLKNTITAIQKQKLFNILDKKQLNLIKEKLDKGGRKR